LILFLKVDRAEVVDICLNRRGPDSQSQALDFMATRGMVDISGTIDLRQQF